MKVKKLIIILIISIVLSIALIGGSVAYLRTTRTQTDSNRITALDCLQITYTSLSNDINLQNTYPISDTKGLQLDPYTFKIKNLCTEKITSHINLETLITNNALSIEYIKVSLDNETPALLSTKPNGTKYYDNTVSSSSKNLASVDLNQNEEREYSLRLWLNEETTLEQARNKTYQGRVIVIAEPYIASTRLKDTILADNEVTEPLSTPGRKQSLFTLSDTIQNSLPVGTSRKDYYYTYGTGISNGTTSGKFTLTGVSTCQFSDATCRNTLIGKYIVGYTHDTASQSGTGTMTYTNIDNIIQVQSINYSESGTSYIYYKLASSFDTKEALLASTPDDYGTSYYFRGAVENNYVVFAGMCWRIVRIDGQGNIKLVLYNYNPDSLTNPCIQTGASYAFARYDNTTNGSNGQSTFNLSPLSNAYIGFMYGTPNSSTYALEHANINKSTILTNLETWYDNNLGEHASKDYTNYLADVIWCNDKSTTGNGYGTTRSNYGPYNRLNDISTASPTLVCPPDKNSGKLSKYTVSDTTNGNGALDYKIGLLTADEIAFAGGAYGLENLSYYLNKNASSSWWLLSIGYFTGSYVYGIGFIPNGCMNYGTVNATMGVRPAVSLKSTITISASGTGTATNPYVVYIPES